MLENQISEVENLILNLSGGLSPGDLQPDEVKLLVEAYGENWFEKMGYEEPYHRKPKC